MAESMAAADIGDLVAAGCPCGADVWMPRCFDDRCFGLVVVAMSVGCGVIGCMG